MKKLFTFIICISLIPIVKADVNKHTLQFAFKLSLLNRVDTNAISPPSPSTRSIYEDNVYKRRLDSVQKDVPLDYNEYVQAYIDTYMGRKGDIARSLGLSKYYFPIYEKAFRDAGIPEEMKYLSIVESELNPNAVSRVGATGLWQFMSETAKIYNLKIDNYVDDRRDPIEATYAAAAYLKDAYQQFGDWLLAIASYNCGKSNVERAMEKTGGHDYWSIREYLPAETRGYVPAYIAVSYMMQYYDKYNITPEQSVLAMQTDTVMVNKYVSLTKISAALGIGVQDMALLNPAYKQLIINGTAAQPRRLVIPQISKDRFAVLYEVLNNPDAPVPAVQSATAKTLQAKTVLPKYYTTKKGETLEDIADRYGVDIEDLKLWNKTIIGIKTGRLQAGVTLKITRG
ncbi:lytic transglycosylase domain-containing protein [Mucilaginibacter segetis]|uniref:Transglycosylase SLT domain-containing protein n=1 Tax=Mucilaginibacter segetis TaxID=2793071 RepID=A0A934UPQ7_9SPHI|nr:lytic transglycosylase domain-containing protein [Mucilaginibacter segetis]MBK0381217.1 transglycosylase SLT domain-containing protein [Mucilaginibacter segetis]